MHNGNGPTSSSLALRFERETGHLTAAAPDGDRFTFEGGTLVLWRPPRVSRRTLAGRIFEIWFGSTMRDVTKASGLLGVLNDFGTELEVYYTDG